LENMWKKKFVKFNRDNKFKIIKFEQQNFSILDFVDEHFYVNIQQTY
jgi:hypothetical protein